MFLLKWFKFNPNNIYSFQFKLYAMTGFWKIDSKSEWKQFLYQFYHILQEFNYLFLLAGFITDAFAVRHDIGKLSTNLVTTIILIGSLIKIRVSRHKMKQIENLRIKLDNNLHLENIGTSKFDEEIIKKHSKEIVFMTMSYFIMAELLCALWFIYPLLKNSKERRLPGAFFPHPKIKETPYYELSYLYQVIAITIFSWKISSYDSMFWGFAGRICAQLDILANNFNNLNLLYTNVHYEEINCWNGEEEDYYPQEYNQNEFVSEAENRNKERWRCSETEKIIKENIVHHKAILKAIEEINDVYQLPVFLQITCCAGVIGIIAYGILEQDELDSEFFHRIVYGACVTFDSFLYCYYGSQIAERSNLVKQALYNCPWYEMEKTSRKLILFIKVKLEKLPEISALKMFPISLKTFVELLKVSYDVIAILRQTKGRNQVQ